MFKTAFLDLPPLTHAGGVITLPGSKSISNRVLLLAALCRGHTTVHELLDSDDTRVMLDALQALGCDLLKNGSTVTITGLARRGSFMGNAGTAMRPLDRSAGSAGPAGSFELRGVRACTSAPLATWSMRCANWAARSTTWEARAIRRCASASRSAPGRNPSRCAATSPASSSPHC
jgi:3-phosphoshikimate 1-carboxyvinyltransferase